MYVNDYTVKLGDAGMAALRRLFTDAYRRKLIPAVPPLDAV
jgi:predicted solute-binding protein